MEGVQVRPLPRAEALRALAEYRGRLEEALEQAWEDGTFDDVWQAVATGAARAWQHQRVVVVTVVVDKDAVVWLAAGERQEDSVEVFMPAIQRWAEGLGCRRVVVYGRRGWTPLLRRQGFEHRWSVLVREL